MKKVFFSLVVFIITSLFVNNVHAQQLSQVRCEPECILSYVSNVDIQADGTILVKEQIEYDFGSADRHGIYRNIPFVKKNNEDKKFQTEINVISVEDEQQEPYLYTIEKEGEHIRIKIGDPDRYVNGKKTYIINYKVSGELLYFSDHDELQWNAVGNDWGVPIAQAKVNVTLPQDISKDDLTATCFAGIAGSTEACTAHLHTGGAIFESMRLEPNEGITFVFGFPKGIVQVLEPKEYTEFFNTPLGIFVAFLIILGLFIWYIGLPLFIALQWFLHGRDPRNLTNLTTWYDPPSTKTGRNLTPAEVGALVDEHAEMHDISAMIVHLAQRGYLKIEERKEKDFYFTKTKEFKNDTTLMSFEKQLLEGIFSIKDSVRIKDENLRTTVENIYETLYKQLQLEGYFPHNPNTIRNIYYALAGFALTTFNIPLTIVGLIFGRHMPRKTLEGVNAAHLANGMKNFLSSQERQLEFQAKNQIMFEKLLPYAIAFKVEKVWAERFKDIQMTSPDWYTGYNSNMFNSVSFTDKLGSSFNLFNSVATPTNSSSGFSSGFSSGSVSSGGGGGGGGSW